MEKEIITLIAVYIMLPILAAVACSILERHIKNRRNDYESK